MSGHRLRFDLRLLREGLEIESRFGWQALRQLVSTGEFVEKALYRRGTLVRTGDRGIRFGLLNPPLRLGAFGSATLHWDGSLIEPTQCFLRPMPEGVPIAFSTLDKTRPFSFLPGQRMEIQARLESAPSPGPHTVRLTLENVAIPPRVWIEIRDRLSED
jgi:hypothetical protein